MVSYSYGFIFGYLFHHDPTPFGFFLSLSFPFHPSNSPLIAFILWSDFWFLSMSLFTNKLCISEQIPWATNYYYSFFPFFFLIFSANFQCIECERLFLSISLKLLANPVSQNCQKHDRLAQAHTNTIHSIGNGNSDKHSILIHTLSVFMAF